MPILILVVVLMIAGLGVFLLWPKIGPWFRDSESILLARAAAALGTLASAFAVIDPALLHQAVEALGLAKYWPFLVIVAGVGFEIARRARDPEMKG